MAVKREPGERPYHHGNLKSALLAAAERVLEQDGLPSLTLRRVARDVGVSHSAPKHAVGDVSGLLAELAASGFERLRAEMEAEGADASTPEARLHALGRRYVRFALAHPALFQLMFRHERLEAGRPTLVAARRALLDILGVAWPAEGEGGEDRRVAMLSAWAQVHGLAMLLLDRQLPPELAGEDVVGRLLAGPSVHG